MLRYGLLLLLAATAAAEPLHPKENVVRVEHRPADQSPSLGPTDAPVTAELFFVPGDIESNRAYQRMVELAARHPRRLRVVFRVIERRAQVIVPLAALEAYAQGKFEAFMDALTAVKSGTVRREALPAIAAAAGMDPVRLDRALERALDPDLEPEPIRANERRRQRQHGANVPELLLNGTPIGQTVAALDVDDLDGYYQTAYEQAEELLDDGVPLRHLVDATERAAAPEIAVTSYPAGPIDDAQPGDEPSEDTPPLLDRALDLTGLPSDGDDDAPVEVIVFCNLKNESCRLQLELARKLLELYPKEARIVWYPWYPVGGDDDTARLHQAALCAQSLGDGWKLIDELLRQVRIGAVRDADGLIDAATRLSGIDADAEARCLETSSTGDLDQRVEAATAAGIRQSPAIVIGGRVYLGGFTDWHAAAPIVDDELAPGLLERMVPSWDEE